MNFQPQIVAESFENPGISVCCRNSGLAMLVVSLLPALAR
jgi:hypothetical protein